MARQASVGDTFTTRTTLGSRLNVWLVTAVRDNGYVRALRVYTHDTTGKAHPVPDGEAATFVYTNGVEWHDESPLYLDGYAAWGRCGKCPFINGDAVREWQLGYYAAEADAVAYAEQRAERGCE